MGEAIRIPTAGNLRAELDAIASVELADILTAWPVLTCEQAARLEDYLKAEMGCGGMLSVEKAREAGQSLGRERADARRVLHKLQETAR